MSSRRYQRSLSSPSLKTLLCSTLCWESRFALRVVHDSVAGQIRGAFTIKQVCFDQSCHPPLKASLVYLLYLHWHFLFNLFDQCLSCTGLASAPSFGSGASVELVLGFQDDQGMCFEVVRWIVVGQMAAQAGGQTLLGMVKVSAKSWTETTLFSKSGETRRLNGQHLLNCIRRQSAFYLEYVHIEWIAYDFEECWSFRGGDADFRRLRS